MVRDKCYTAISLVDVVPADLEPFGLAFAITIIVNYSISYTSFDVRHRGPNSRADRGAAVVGRASCSRPITNTSLACKLSSTAQLPN